MVTVSAFRVEHPADGSKTPVAAHPTHPRARVTKDIESERLLLPEADGDSPSTSKGAKDKDEEDYR